MAARKDEADARRKSFRSATTKRFAENMRFQRECENLSQEDLAVLASIHRTEVSLLERAERTPRIDTLIKIAGAIGVQPGELLEGIEWEPEGEPPLPLPGHDRAPRSRRIDYDELARLWREGMPVADIAKRLDTTAGTVGQIVNRLRNRGADLPYRRPALSEDQAAARRARNDDRR